MWTQPEAKGQAGAITDDDNGHEDETMMITIGDDPVAAAAAISKTGAVNPESSHTRYSCTYRVAVTVIAILVAAVTAGLVLGLRPRTTTNQSSATKEAPQGTQQQPQETKQCCNPDDEPGVNDNTLCLEGHACCSDGTWACSIGDGKTFSCGNELVVSPNGTVCDSNDCLNSNYAEVGICLKTTEELSEYCTEQGCANIDCIETECITFEEANNCWIEDCETFDCYARCRPVIGRPFKENINGNAILAEAHPMECGPMTDVCFWSKSTALFPTVNQDEAFALPVNRASDTAADWIDQGLGEHASIASFAAFTISLMTNQAPPDLVRDALKAALDELDHAERSFGLARILSQGEGIMVPGPLPASQIRFESDLTSLAIATAREGCIEETMSALELAIQADELTALLEDDLLNKSTTDRILLESKWKIAMDEARHSSLAWRTIQWVCQTDQVACNAVQEEVLNGSYLSNAAPAERFGKSKGIAKLAWEQIYSSLLPVVVASHDSKVLSESDKKEATVLTTSCVSRLVETVVNGVLNNSLIEKDQSSMASY